MIVGIYHQGSGLGNQLHRYVMTRVLALDKGFEWGMLVNNNDSTKAPNFKGESFMNGDFYGLNPVALGWPGGFSNFFEKKIVENGVDIRGYDPEINFVQDNTVIDGEFQDERYFYHRLDEINQWLEVEQMKLEENVCVVGFRGGEFALFPDLFLSQKWWDNAKRQMRLVNPNMEFRIVTDDPLLAKQFFPADYVTHETGEDWRAVRFAKYAIISNSSFYILPRLLKHHTSSHLQVGSEVITFAPRYWARNNVKVWALPQNYYRVFTYL